VLDGSNVVLPTLIVVLTGRNAPDEIIERGNLVTEMTLVKHPLKHKKVARRRGSSFDLA